MAALMSMTLAFVSCSDDDKKDEGPSDPLVGNTFQGGYRTQERGDINVELPFKADDKVSKVEKNGEGEVKNTAEGAYTFTPDAEDATKGDVTITFEGKSQTGVFSDYGRGLYDIKFEIGELFSVELALDCNLNS